MEKKMMFDFENKNVRTLIRDGEVWFVAKDICNVLGISNNSDAIGRLSEHMKGVVTTDTLGGSQRTLMVNEAGMYKLIFTSRKKEAERFTNWVVTDVLPTIRKTGGYVVQGREKDFVDNYFSGLSEDTMKMIQKDLEVNNKKITDMQNKITQLELQVNNHNQIISELNTYTMRQISNMLNYGRNKIFKILRDRDILDNNNLPSIKHVTDGYFRVRQTSVFKGNHYDKVPQLLVTALGLDLINKILDEERM